ncbi:MAG: class IV adenylate cyclase [Candidatus Acidiferrales bacterium]|jgi:adenylate cyclase class 2
MANNGREIEVKLRIADLNALRAQLRRLGAKAAPRIFERNILYDTQASDLRETGRLLRIRIKTPAPDRRTATSAGRAKSSAHKAAESRGVLTYKAPVVPSLDVRFASRYKEREEIEIEFNPAENLETIFAALGLRSTFRYEKFRTSYSLRRVPGLHLDLDETPLGNYLELEGSTAAIDRAAVLLGFSPQDYITATYWDLHVADSRGRNVAPGDLVFKNRKK